MTRPDEARPFPFRWAKRLLVLLVVAFFLREVLEYRNRLMTSPGSRLLSTAPVPATDRKSPLSFMNSSLILLVSHDLSLSGAPLLLMEFAFLLKGVGAEVVWITHLEPTEEARAVGSLKLKLSERGVQVFPGKSQEAFEIATKADLVILNTVVAGEWLDLVPEEHLPRVLPKIVWWIHEIRARFFSMECVKRLPFVAGAIVDSYKAADHWKNITRHRLGIQMPPTFVAHLGNKQELMVVAEDAAARGILREHVRESLGVGNDDLLFAIINSVSRGKGQDLFLQAFSESLELIKGRGLKLPALHAVIVGCRMNSGNRFEGGLQDFVANNSIQDRVHFVKKTLTVAPYLSAIDVLVQNSQDEGECFGRITIEAMAFKLPVLGTSVGGTTEIILDGETGLLYPIGKEGVTPLANNIIKLASHVEQRLTMGRKGYDRVKERFMEEHMVNRIGLALRKIVQNVTIL